MGVNRNSRPPTFDRTITNRTLDETDIVGTPVITITATDPDPGVRLSHASWLQQFITFLFILMASVLCPNTLLPAPWPALAVIMIITLDLKSYDLYVSIYDFQKSLRRRNL